MLLNRREFIKLAAAGIAAHILTSNPLARAATSPKIKAIAFDAFPIFDPRPIFTLAEQLFPGRGAELSNAWRTRQFEYQWLRALSGRYADFWRTTEDALVFSAEMLKLDLTPNKRTQLMDCYLGLKAWPDVPPALQSLKSAGIRLAFLSNATPKILDAGIKNSGLDGIFEHVLSTDKIKTYKPDPRAYQMAIDALVLKKEEILFVAFAGWDAAGAKSFGYTTFWVNRLNVPTERLGASPDAVGQNLNDLVGFVKAQGGFKPQVQKAQHDAA
ncbi:MAG: haloacid dehalogenase type II [Gammaproteobacteria bacterium]|nr:haloacid dehalogenase type II [Gammaproteobacteria bacterium]